jgi:hypothetical protein
MMNVQPTNDYGRTVYPPSSVKEEPRGVANTPGAVLDTLPSKDSAQTAGPSSDSPPADIRSTFLIPLNTILSDYSSPPSSKQVAITYAQAANVQKRAGLEKDLAQGSDWQKYKDDQLLRDPGGDHYYLEENRVSKDPKDRELLLTRLEKDLSDSFGNVQNFFGNLLMGSKFRYRDENNESREATQQGLVGACVDFFKNLGSALSLGFWRSGDEKEPQGGMERLSYVGSKLNKAFLSDLVEGIPQSVNHMAKNLVLAGLNLVQVLPDATIGNLEEGRKLTTTVFDDGQVMVEYLTDVIPSGNAWFRVHASSLLEGNFPILYNLQMPEHLNGDARWQYVRNTPFRKTVETVGTLLADIASIGMTGQSGISANQNCVKQRYVVAAGKETGDPLAKVYTRI